MAKFFISLVIFALVAGSALADPELAVPDNRFDFGWVPHSSTVVHYFWLKSVGSDTLDIVTTATKNDDSRMPLPKQSIPPGDSILAGFYWDVGSRSGAESQYASVFTNSMAPKPGRAIIEGKVVARPDSILPVTVLPYKFEFSKIGKVAIDSIGFTMINHSERDFEITTVSFPLEECELVLPDSLKAYEQQWGYIRIHPGYLDREFMRSVTIEVVSGDTYKKRLTVPIRRKILSP